MCSSDLIESHRGRITALVGNHVHLVALAPARQLLARRRPERVARRQQHRLIDLMQMARQLADRRRLAGPVHPGDHHHQRISPVHVDGLLQRRQKLRQDVDQRRLQRCRIVDPVALGPLAQLFFVEYRAFVGNQRAPIFDGFVP